MNYTIINREAKVRPNHIQRVKEERTNIASISEDINKNLLEVFSLLRERLKTVSDRVDFERVVSNVLNVIRKRKIELARVKRLEDMKANAGFTLISIIIAFGIIGLVLIMFLIAKSILY